MYPPILTNISNVENALQKYNIIVAIGNSPNTTTGIPIFDKIIQNASTMDPSVCKGVSTFYDSGNVYVYSGCGPLNRDYDDVRSIHDAVSKGITKAKSMKQSKKICLILTSDCDHPGPLYDQSCLVGIIAATHACHAKLQTRERYEHSIENIEDIGIVWQGHLRKYTADELNEKCKIALGMALGQRIARDITDGDPERMAPLKVADYVDESFQGVDNVQVNIERDRSVINSKYPLLSAVSRTSVDRHAPAVIELEYTPPTDAIEKTIYLIGKGVTYDTGGADLKVGGTMNGLKTDKGGAGACAGIMRAIAHIKPRGVKVIAYLGMVRNSIGSNAYVADEIIQGHSGRRVLVVNTDAEGRMVMADLLSLARTRIKKEKNNDTVNVFSIATLTGHAYLAFGPYSSVNLNGVSSFLKLGVKIAALGQELADPFEQSTLRREDYFTVSPKSGDLDVIQSTAQGSAKTMRGHQFPMAFLNIASGLNDHGVTSDMPIPYVHVDMIGRTSTGGKPSMGGRSNGAPVVALTAYIADLFPLKDQVATPILARM